MPLEPCEECGHLVAHDADACPSCGHRVPIGKGCSIALWVVVGIITFVVLVSIVADCL